MKTKKVFEVKFLFLLPLIFTALGVSLVAGAVESIRHSSKELRK